MTDWKFDLKKIALSIKSQNKIDKFIELAASHKLYFKRSCKITLFISIYLTLYY